MVKGVEIHARGRIQKLNGRTATVITTTMLNILNSVAACALITWSYAASLRWRRMQTKTEEPEQETMLDRIKTVLAAETDEEKNKAYYISLSIIRSLKLCIDQNDQLTIGDFLKMTPSPVEEETDTESSTGSATESVSETNSETPSLQKHVCLLERFIDELQVANQQWAEHADELHEEKRQLEQEKRSIYRMTYTVLLVGVILVPVYTMIIYKHILTS